MSKEEKLLDYRRKVVPTKEGQWTSATGEGNVEHMQGKYMLPRKEDISPTSDIYGTGRQVKWFCPLRTECSILHVY